MDTLEVIAVALMAIVCVGLCAITVMCANHRIKNDNAAFSALDAYRTKLFQHAERIRNGAISEEDTALYEEAVLDYRKNKDALDVSCPKNPIFLGEVLNTQRAILDFTHAYENAKAKSE